MEKYRFIVLGLGILLASCQSEYSERMNKAMQLKKEYQKVHKYLKSSKSSKLIAHLSEIKREIRFHASVSGNEELFLQEVWNN